MFRNRLPNRQVHSAWRKWECDLIPNSIVGVRYRLEGALSGSLGWGTPADHSRTGYQQVPGLSLLPPFPARLTDGPARVLRSDPAGQSQGFREEINIVKYLPLARVHTPLGKTLLSGKLVWWACPKKSGDLPNLTQWPMTQKKTNTLV